MTPTLRRCAGLCLQRGLMPAWAGLAQDRSQHRLWRVTRLRVNAGGLVFLTRLRHDAPVAPHIILKIERSFVFE